MFFGLMKWFAKLYYGTWFIWPLVLVFSFSYGLAKIIKDDSTAGKSIIIAGISLLIILAGIVAPVLKL